MQTTRLYSRTVRRTFSAAFRLTLLPLLLVAALSSLAAAPSSTRANTLNRPISVYTVNAYIGADLSSALSIDPNNPQEVLLATTAIFTNIINSDPAMRMHAIAANIAANKPDFVGAVELYTIELAPIVETAPGAFTVVYDYLDLLKQALAAHGANYHVVVVSQQSRVALPLLNPENPTQLIVGRITDHEAILVRSDLPRGSVRLSNPRSGSFLTRITLPEAGIDLKRGWCSIDATLPGEKIRLVCTHLEDDFAAPIQFAQAMELLAGPASGSLPVILMGDFNADPLSRNRTLTYPLFAGAGFRDAWLQLNQQHPAAGLTWGHDAGLADPSDPVEWRLDMVFYRGGRLNPVSAQVIDIPTGSNEPPLWGTDHKALTASFNIGKPRPIVTPNAGNRLSSAPR